MWLIDVDMCLQLSKKLYLARKCPFYRVLTYWLSVNRDKEPAILAMLLLMSECEELGDIRRSVPVLQNRRNFVAYLANLYPMTEQEGGRLLKVVRDTPGHGKQRTPFKWHGWHALGMEL